MDHDKAMKELDKILDALTQIDDPGSKEYKDILQSYERLYKLVWDECKNCDDQVEKKHRQEIEKKRLEIEERKLALEEKKIEISKENDLARNELEKKKIGHISLLKILKNDLVFWVRDYHICEIRNLNNFDEVIKRFNERGSEILAFDVIYTD